MAVALALFSFVQINDSFSSHSSGLSQPCSVQIRGQMLPVSHLGEPRNNPDGTYYPADAFYFIIQYSASPTCIDVIVDPLRYEGLDIRQGGASYADTNYDYVDAASRKKLKSTVDSMCSTIRAYSGCVFGIATVMDIVDCTQVDPDRCINKTAKIVQKVTGLKKVCSSDGDGGGTKCRIVPVVRTVTLSPDILIPELDVILSIHTVQDDDGYHARNLDGTYYVWDPMVIQQIPDLLWKNDRSNTIHFEVTKTPDSQMETFVDCANNSCIKILEWSGVRTTTWSLGNGDDITLYNATDDSHLGINFFEYDVEAYNAGVLLDSDSDKIETLVVRYDPEYSQYPYSVLSDDHRTSYENRAAVALHYFGSFGGGPDDVKSSLHEDRRSKINNFLYFGVGFNPWNPVLFNDALHWNKTQDAGILELPHRTVSESRYSDVTASSNNDVIPCETKTDTTATFVRAGYCTIYFQYPILDTVYGPTGPRYENATLFNTLLSDHFAGKDRSYFAHYEYRFPEPFFNTNLHVKSIRDDGNEDLVIRVDIMPKNNVKTATTTIQKYLHEKIIYDSADPGFGNMISNDTYPVRYSQSDTNNLDVKLRRIATKFESYQDTNNQNVAGLDITHLASAYLGNSRDARLEVPLDVGLGALSPISLNVTAGNIFRHYEYDYVDFGADMEILINTAQDNTMEILRNPGSVIISVNQDFGEVTKLYVDGVALNATCNTRCAINTDRNDEMLITAQNAWGGQARGVAVEFIPEKRVSIPSSNLIPIVLFALLLVPTYWIYQRVKNHR